MALECCSRMPRICDFMTHVSSVSSGSYLRAWVLHGLAEVIEEHGGDPAAYERRFHLPLHRTDLGQDLVPAPPLRPAAGDLCRRLRVSRLRVSRGAGSGRGAARAHHGRGPAVRNSPGRLRIRHPLPEPAQPCAGHHDRQHRGRSAHDVRTRRAGAGRDSAVPGMDSRDRRQGPPALGRTRGPVPRRPAHTPAAACLSPTTNGHSAVPSASERRITASTTTPPTWREA